MGSVAGGGDPAAVVPALDFRIACAVPFNYLGSPGLGYPSRVVKFPALISLLF
jgi:hypothetical protein